MNQPEMLIKTEDVLVRLGQGAQKSPFLKARLRARGVQPSE
jgi:hypothetical protein